MGAKSPPGPRLPASRNSQATSRKSRRASTRAGTSELSRAGHLRWVRGWWLPARGDPPEGLGCRRMPTDLLSPPRDLRPGLEERRPARALELGDRGLARGVAPVGRGGLDGGKAP